MCQIYCKSYANELSKKITVVIIYKFQQPLFRPENTTQSIINVQHRATRMIADFSSFSYEQRLSKLKLTTLETRRLRGDLIEVFKIMKSFDNVDYRDFFTLSTNRSRGHSMKLFKIRFNTNCGKFIFSNRIIEEWNMLSEDVISSKSVEVFKAKLDQYLWFSRGVNISL